MAQVRNYSSLVAQEYCMARHLLSISPDESFPVQPIVDKQKADASGESTGMFAIDSVQTRYHSEVAIYH